MEVTKQDDDVAMAVPAWQLQVDQVTKYDVSSSRSELSIVMTLARVYAGT